MTVECTYFIACVTRYCLQPATMIFLGAAVLLTLKTRFIQIRALPRLFRIVFRSRDNADRRQKAGALPRYRALFTAMGTTLGMGNVVGPALAIAIGGPGALFWLVAYAFFGSVSKFIEVVFAIRTRETLASGIIVGGPMRYLALISQHLGMWYAAIAVVLFTAWSALQANTLACIACTDGVPQWLIGLLAGGFVAVVLMGGAQRVGMIASRLVPLMCLLYIGCSVFILLKNPGALLQALQLVVSHAFSPAAAYGGFLGATVFDAMRVGVSKSIFITEAGLGTGSIAHALADTENPVDQAVLALYSMFADVSLCLLSGLIALVSGVWQLGLFDASIMYRAFKELAPAGGAGIFLASVLLLVTTTLIGNSFNGNQMFVYLTNNRYTKWYVFLSALIVFGGALCSVPLLWAVIDVLLAMVAVPNALALIVLAYRYPSWWRLN